MDYNIKYRCFRSVSLSPYDVRLKNPAWPVELGFGCDFKNTGYTDFVYIGGNYRSLHNE